MKKILIFSSILVVLVVAGAIYYFNWRHNFIRKEVPQLVFLKSDSLYNISYGDVYIDEINGEVSIDNIVLRPDTTHRKEPGKKLPKKMIEVSIPRLHITGIHTDQAVLNEEMIAHKLQLSRPILTLYDNDGDEKKEKKVKSDSSSAPDLYRAILRNLIRIKIDTILIDTAHYNMVRWKTGDTVLTGTNVNVLLYNLDISDSTSTDTSRILFAKRAEVNFDKLKISNESGLYVYRIDDAVLNSEQKFLTIKSLAIDPLYSEAEFAKAVGTESDRFDINFSGVQFNNIDVEQVLGGNLVAGTVAVKEGIFKIYRDKNYKRKSGTKVGRFPHQLLMKAPLAMALGRMDINSGYIEYKEKSDLTGNTGKISFQNSSISITNFTNRTNDLRENPSCLVNLRAQFLDVIPVNVTLRLYPAHESGKFIASGNLGSADATVFNQLVQPLGLATIESGNMNGCSFNISGDDYGSNGTVKLLYDHLKVKLLEKDPADGKYKPKKLASFLANAVMKDENPKKNKPPRVARVSYTRDPNKGFFNLVWKSVFAGVSETVGIETGKSATIIKRDNQ